MNTQCNYYGISISEMLPTSVSNALNQRHSILFVASYIVLSCPLAATTVSFAEQFEKAGDMSYLSSN